MKLDVERGRPWPFEPDRFFFPVANDATTPAPQVALLANGRRDQEDLIARLKGGVNVQAMPAGDLVGNRADVVRAPLAWGLKVAPAPLMPEHLEGRKGIGVSSGRCHG
jgi:hypothetical protein